MNDVLGQALHDTYYQDKPAELWINNRYGPKEEMPVDVYFRHPEDMPELELLAIKNCKGRVFDIGAGSGSHALLLQQQHFDVTALDISPMAMDVAKARGVIKTIAADIFAYSDSQYDTLLLLMNGIGLAGTLSGLKLFLQHAKTLLKTGGQIIFDSSDIAYLYEGDLPEDGKYYGEIWYQYEYKSQQTEWFKWLYIDQHTLTTLAITEGWNVEILGEDEYDQYLVKLTMA